VLLRREGRAEVWAWQRRDPFHDLSAEPPPNTLKDLHSGLFG